MLWPLQRSSSSERGRPLTPLEKLKGYYDLAKVRYGVTTPAQLRTNPSKAC